MINQAVPPGGDSGIALRWVEACDLPKRVRLGCAIFGRGGLRSRIPRTLKFKQDEIHWHVLFCFWFLGPFLSALITQPLFT